MELTTYKKKRIIPKDWKEIKLGEEFKTSSGATPLSTKREYYEGGTISWINSGELDSPFIYKAANFITQKGFDNSSTTIYPQDTILVAMYGATAGKASLLKMEACTNQAICAILPNKDYSPEFIKYNLDTLYDHLVGLSSGSARDNLSQAGIKELKLIVPQTKREQESLVTILSLIDKKIELNRQINDNLEAMAKQLYDYWFVQFDFPNEEGKPYKSSDGAMVWNEKLKREIPTFFDVKLLSEIIEVKDGTHDSPKPQDNGYFLLTSKHLTERGLDYASAYKISKEDYESINKRSKVDTNDILFSMIGTIGNSYFVEETNINFAIKNMALFKTSAKQWFSEYLYLYLSSCDYKHYEGNSLSGSIQKFVSLRTLRDMPILYHEDIIKVFAKEVRNIITMMVNLRKENIELTKQRDELLPLLMNGQALVNYHLSLHLSNTVLYTLHYLGTVLNHVVRVLKII